MTRAMGGRITPAGRSHASQQLNERGHGLGTSDPAHLRGRPKSANASLKTDCAPTKRCFRPETNGKMRLTG